MKQVSTGGLPFREIRRRGKYYVDKTLLIKDMLEPKRDGDMPIIMESKVADSGSDFDIQATEAIQQIHDRKYCLGMKGDVILIGLAFRGKVVRGKVEKVFL